MDESVTKIKDDFLAPEPMPYPASINKRFTNFLIDVYILLLTYIWSIFFLVFLFKFIPDSLLLAISFFVYYFLYYFLFESFIYRTPAKFFTSTKVFLVNNKEPGAFRILARCLSRLIPVDMFSYLFSTRPRGLHDRLSGTLTADLNYGKIKSESFFRNFILMFFEGILFLFLLSASYFVFRYFILNVMPEMKFINQIPGLISREISSLSQTKTANINYTDTDFGISITYTDNWVKVGDFDDPVRQAILFIRSDKALIKIEKPIRANAVKLEELSQAQDYFEVSRAGKILTQDKVIINDRDFFRFVSRESSSGQELTLAGYIHETDGKIYVITYAGYADEYDKYLPEAEQIIKTLTIK